MQIKDSFTTHEIHQLGSYLSCTIANCTAVGGAFGYMLASSCVTQNQKKKKYIKTKDKRVHQCITV